MLHACFCFFACLFSTSAFCSNEMSSDNASELFKSIGWTTHWMNIEPHQNPGSCCLRKLFCFRSKTDLYYWLTPPQTQRKEELYRFPKTSLYSKPFCFLSRLNALLCFDSWALLWCGVLHWANPKVQILRQATLWLWAGLIYYLN